MILTTAMASAPQDAPRHGEQRTHAQVQLAAFCVGHETYAVDIMRVREVARATHITPVRRGPRALGGLLSRRGALLPVAHMRVCFGLPPLMQPKQRILVVIAAGRDIGLLVDGNIAVLQVERRALRPPSGILSPSTGPSTIPFFLGACQVRQTTVMLLNLRHVVASMSPWLRPEDK